MAGEEQAGAVVDAGQHEILRFLEGRGIYRDSEYPAIVSSHAKWP